MKKFTLCSLLLLFSVICWRCEDDFQSSMKLGDFTFKLDTTTWNVPVSGGRNYLTLESPGDWTIKIKYPEGQNEWVQISDTAGGFGKYKLTLLTGPNKSYDDSRQAYLVMTCGELKDSVLIFQPTPKGAFLEEDKFAVESGDTTIFVKFIVNVPYRYAIEESAQKWIVPSETSKGASMTMEIPFDIKKSNRPRERVGKITIFTDITDTKTDSVTVTITQSPQQDLMEYQIYEKNDLRGNISFTIEGNTLEAWFLRSTPDVINKEPHMYNTTNWWYAVLTTPGNSSVNYGNADHSLGSGSIAQRFYASTAFGDLCYMGSGTHNIKLYAWNTDYATTVAGTPVFDENPAFSGGWTYPIGEQGKGGRILPAGDYLAVATGAGSIRYTEQAADDEVVPYVNGEPSNKCWALSYLPCLEVSADFANSKTFPYSTLMKIKSDDGGKTWNNPEFVYTMNAAMFSYKDGDVYKLNYATDMHVIKIGSDYYMAVSNNFALFGNDKAAYRGIVVAKSAGNSNNWQIVTPNSFLKDATKVISMFVQDGWVYLYYQKGSEVRVATTSTLNEWYNSLTDRGVVYTIPTGVTGVSVVYNANISKFQLIYTKGGSIESYVAANGIDKFTIAGDTVVDETRTGASQIGYFVGENGVLPNEAKNWVGYSYSGGIVVMPM